MKLTFEIGGVKQMMGELEAWELRKRGAIATLITKYALKIERSAKKNAPVDTGRLRASIRTILDQLALGAEVGTEVEYAEYLEYGTSKMPPMPFLRPAFEEHIGDFLRDVREVLSS